MKAARLLLCLSLSASLPVFAHFDGEDCQQEHGRDEAKPEYGLKAHPERGGPATQQKSHRDRGVASVSEGPPAKGIKAQENSDFDEYE